MKRVNLNIVNQLLFLFCMSLLVGSCKTNKLNGQNNLTEKINEHWFYDAKTKVYSYDSSFNNILENNAEQLKKMNKEQIQQVFGNASQISNIKKIDGSNDGYYLFYYEKGDCSTNPLSRKYSFYFNENDQLINWGDLEGSSSH